MKKALGRGLDALIPGADKDGFRPDGDIRVVSLEKIRRNHLQPRKNFDPEKLAELASSIKQHGLAQPLLVSHDPVADVYELIAGERRWRACALAGLKEIEVVVREPDSEKKRMVLALIENIQRENLNEIEAALGYRRLMREFQVSQGELGHIVGKSKSAVSNTLRLLDLPEDVQKAVEFGRLSAGHARALLMVPDALERNKIFRVVMERGLSVREAEDRARAAAGNKTRRRSAARPARSPDIELMESELQRILGTRVEIRSRGGKGRLVIHFYSLDEFERISERIKKN